MAANLIYHVHYHISIEGDVDAEIICTIETSNSVAS
jgi:hypothetical protein